MNVIARTRASITAEERKHRFNLERSSTRCEELQESNFATEEDPKLADAEIKVKTAEIAKENDGRKKSREGGDFREKQVGEEGFRGRFRGGGGGGVYDCVLHGIGFGGGSDGVFDVDFTMEGLGILAEVEVGMRDLLSVPVSCTSHILSLRIVNDETDSTRSISSRSG